MVKNLFILCFLVSLSIHQTSLAQTTVVKSNNNWEIHVDGKPFEIKGVTIGFENDTLNYDMYFKDLKFLGVNAIRTWATGNNTKKLLDFAYQYNIKVMVGIWMRHGRPGMEDDDRFNYLEDSEVKEIMYENALKVVETYKNHPAVLIWGIGNEVYLNTATDEEKMSYSQLLERICSTIKKNDSNHPITSVEAWTFGLDWWSKYVPSIDIYGLNSYGAGVNLLAEELIKRGIDKPYIITEYGVTGEWDIKQEKNGVVVEPNDAQKQDAIASGIKEWIVNKPANLGVFVFHYADGNDFIAPWLFTHFDNSKRPQYWAIREVFTGEKPLESIPKITLFEVSKDKANSDVWIPVRLEIDNPEKDSLEISFRYNQRTGSRKRRDQLNQLEFRGSLQNGFEIKLPKENGAVKIYAVVKNQANNIGISSTGIVLIDEVAKNRKYLVPKVSLPFYVYKDGENMPYFPSAYMGNHKSMTVDTQNTSEVYSGKASLKIAYNQEHDWYGLGLVNPANDWGEILGGYDITGAKKFTFWAKASKKEVIATIGFGLIGKDKKYPDTAKKAIEVTLTTKWKKYSITIKDLDLSCIRSGFTLFSTSYRTTQDIFIDEVVFE